MRLICLFVLVFLSTSVYAEEAKTTDLKPLPPPPSIDTNESPDEPGVTITKQTEQTVEEFRSHGKLT